MIYWSSDGIRYLFWRYPEVTNKLHNISCKSCPFDDSVVQNPYIIIIIIIIIIVIVIVIVIVVIIIIIIIIIIIRDIINPRR